MGASKSYVPTKGGHDVTEPGQCVSIYSTSLYSIYSVCVIINHVAVVLPDAANYPKD